MLAPAKTARPVVALLNREIVSALQTSDMKDRLASEGSSVVASTPEYLGTHIGAYIRQEIAKWQKVVKDAHIRLDASR